MILWPVGWCWNWLKVNESADIVPTRGYYERDTIPQFTCFFFRDLGANSLNWNWKMMPFSRMGTGVVSLWLRGYISQHQCEQCGLTVKSCWYNISKQISGIWVFCTNRSLWKGICPGVLHTKHFVLKNALKYSWSLFTSSWLHGCTTKGYKNMLWLKNSLLIGMVENK